MRKADIAESPAVEALLNKCERHMEEGQVEAALASAETACRKAPRSIVAQLYRAAALTDLERIEEAHAVYQNVLSLDRDSPGTLASVAQFLITVVGEDPECLDEGLELARRGAGVLKKSDNPDPELLADLLLLEGLGTTAQGDFRAALERFEEAIELVGRDPSLLLERAVALFELCRFDDSRVAFDEILQENPDDPIAHYHLGLLKERRGEDPVAARHFAAARRIAPDHFPEPISLTEDEFEEAIEDALAELPEKVRRYLSNVAITVENFPADEDLLGNDPPLSPTSLGMFRGTPIGDQSTFDPWSHFPSSIALYQRNLERYATSRENLVEEIEVTLLHEVGHFLGLDEDDLRERNLH